MRRSCFKCGKTIDEIVNQKFFDYSENEDTLYVCENCSKNDFDRVVVSSQQRPPIKACGRQLQATR